MSRVAWLAIVVLGLIGLGALGALNWANSEPALACPPPEIRVRQTAGSSIAVCGDDGSTRAPTAGAILTLGGKLDLNRATADELVAIPGIGPSLARALTKAREKRGGFHSWTEVYQVKGVGPSKLEMLRATTSLLDSEKQPDRD